MGFIFPVWAPVPGVPGVRVCFLSLSVSGASLPRMNGLVVHLVSNQVSIFPVLFGVDSNLHLAVESFFCPVLFLKHL